jgi:hypothetical protein
MENDDNNLIASSIFEFKHAPLEKYPDGIGYFPVEEVIADNELFDVPEAIRSDAEKLVDANPDVRDWCTIPTDQNQFIILSQKMKSKSTSLGNMSKNNVVVWTSNDKTSVIKIANLHSRLRNNWSSIGYDPYKLEPKTLGSNFEKAVTFKPTMQHVTHAIAQKLLKKHNSDIIEYLPTWLYSVRNGFEGQPYELDDANYIVVQAAIPASFHQFSSLSTTEKKAFLEKLNLKKFYAAIKYIHYAFPSEDNLWVNTENGKVVLPDLESPDNEGLGQTAKYGKAILGQSLWKARHNIRNWYDGGHRTFETILKQHGTQNQCEEWLALYEGDDSVK